MNESELKSSVDDKELPKQIINGWDENSTNTIKAWQNDLMESSFIYGEQLNSVERQLNIAVLVPLLCGSVVTLISGVNVALSSLGEKAGISHWVLFSFNIFTLFSGVISSVCSSLVKVLHLDSKTKELSQYIAKLDSQFAVFETELTIPPDQRQNAIDFIKREDGNYLHLIQQAPHLSTDDNIKYRQAYIQKIRKHQEFERLLEQTTEY